MARIRPSAYPSAAVAITVALLLGGGPEINAAAAWYARQVIWQGKVFDPARGELRNLITPFGIRAIIAKVYPGSSWSDGKPCIVLDYAKTSVIAARNLR